MIKLIVNGDDFGLTSGVNRAIINAHKEGILTSTTLMAAGLAWQEAVELAKATPTLAVGVHLTLTALRPVLPAGQVPSLTDGEGRFRRKLLRVPWLDRDQIETEWRAQIQRVVEAGLQPTHLDSHHHVHLLPPLMTIACRLAEEYGICGVRAISPVSFKMMPAPLWQRMIAKASWQRALLCPLGKPNTVAALEAVGKGKVTYYLQKLGPGIHELYAHPGSPGDDQLVGISSLVANRIQETKLLCSQPLKDTLLSMGVGLTSYKIFSEEAVQ